MELECRRCQRPVKLSAAQFDVFERMHYVCFHYEFEHGEFDVDEECTAGGCPSTSLAKGRDRVIATARDLAEEAALARLGQIKRSTSTSKPSRLGLTIRTATT